MTNHNYLYVVAVGLKQIKEDIDEINLRRFHGELGVEYQYAPSRWDREIKSDVIYIWIKEDDMAMWFNEEGVLEIRNQGGGGFHWVGYIIETELSVKYGALKGSDGCGTARWKGDLSKWKTYKEYLLKGGKSGYFRRRWADKIAKEEAKYYDCETFKE
jgi:hypothetical protein